MLQFRCVGMRSGCALSGRRRSLMTVVVALIAIVAALATAPRATAQGVGEALPKQVTTAELVRYMQQLNLSPQQQMAVTNMHDDYKRSYAQLYESDIEPFLDETRGFGGAMPKRNELEKIIRKMRSLEGRVHALDSALFDHMQTLLTDDQLARMPRVRLARLRACYNQQQLLQMWTMGSPLIDVSATIYDLKLPAEHMALIDPTIARYESNVTGRIGRLHDNATTLWLDIFDAIEAAGFNVEELQDMGNADPEEMQRFFAFMRETVTKMTEKGRAEVMRLNNTNRQQVQAIRGVVPDDIYRTIRNAYYVRAYPNTSAITMGAPFGAAALKDVKELEPDKRAAAEDALVRALADLDTIVESAADAVDAFRASLNIMDFDNTKYQDHSKKMEEFQKQASAVTERLNAQLQELFTAEQLGQWQQRLAVDSKRISPSMQGVIAEVIEDDEPAESDEELEAAQVSYGMDQFLPTRISQRDLTMYLALLSLDEDQQAIIKELYNTYAEAFGQLEQEQIKEVNDLRMEMWRYDEDGVRATTPADIDNVYAKRRLVIDAIAAVDQSFFEDVQLLISDENALKRLQRVQLLRSRQNYLRTTSANNYGWGNSDSESRIDIIELLSRQQLDQNALANIEPVLAQYEEQAMPLMKQRFETAMDVQRTQEIWGLRWQEMQSKGVDDASSAKLIAEYQESIASTQKKIADVDRKVSELNSTIFEKVVAGLPTDKTGDVRDAYQRLAFPSVYKDSGAMKKKINKSIDLNDLTAEQQASLVDLRAEYQPAYTEVSDRMLTLTRASPVRNMTSDREDWSKYSEFHDKFERLQFERAELNSRALLRLRAVLTEAQIEAIGGLPEVAKRNTDQAAW